MIYLFKIRLLLILCICSHLHGDFNNGVFPKLSLLNFVDQTNNIALRPKLLQN